MGNTIAVSDTKLDLEAVVFAASAAGPTGPSEKRKKFASVLVAWRITDKHGGCASEFVQFDGLKSFSSRSCYGVVLVTRKTRDKGSTPRTATVGPGDSVKASVSKLLTSVIDNLTPRGLNSGWRCARKTDNAIAGATSAFQYNAYMWAGRRSTVDAKAYCMAQLSRLCQTFDRGDDTTLDLVHRSGSRLLRDVFNMDTDFGEYEQAVHLLRERAALGEGQRDGGSGVKNSLQDVSYALFARPELAPVRRKTWRAAGDDIEEKTPASVAATPTGSDSSSDSGEDSDSSSSSSEDESSEEDKKDAGSKPASAVSSLKKMPMPVLRSPKRTTSGSGGMVPPLLHSPPPQRASIVEPDLTEGDEFSHGLLSAFNPEDDGGPEPDADEEPPAEDAGHGQRIRFYDVRLSEITPQIYLGSATGARKRKWLQKRGITHIVNCASMILKNWWPDDFQYLSLFLLDGKREDVLCMACYVLEWMDNAIRNGGKVFVHCVAEDHEILTEEGFLSLDAYRVRTADASKRPLRVAGYRPDLGQLVFEEPLAIVDQPARAQQLVEFSHPDVASAWDDDVSQSARAPVSLRVTTGHDMYVKRERWANGVIVEEPYAKVVAQELVNNSRSVTLLGRAEGGLLASAEASSFPFAGVETERQIVAFLEVYGFLMLDSTSSTEWLEERLRLLLNVSAPSSSGRVDEWVWQLEKPRAQAVLRGMSAACGGVDCGETFTLLVPTMRLREDAVRLALHAGLAAHFRRDEQLWAVVCSGSSSVAEPVLETARDIRRVAYSGRTWCLTMPSGFIVTRRVRVHEGEVVQASMPIICGNCQQGVSRSTTMVELYLMWKWRMSYRDTHNKVKIARNVASPNPGFIVQLLMWEKRLLTPAIKPRLLLMAPQSTYDPDLIVPKLTTIKNPMTLMSNEVYILHSLERMWIWVGKNSPESHQSGALRVAPLMSKFEAAPSQLQTVQEESEPAQFWSDLYGGDNASPRVAALPLATPGRVTPAVKSISKAGAIKLPLPPLSLGASQSTTPSPVGSVEARRPASPVKLKLNLGTISVQRTTDLNLAAPQKKVAPVVANTNNESSSSESTSSESSSSDSSSDSEADPEEASSHAGSRNSTSGASSAELAEADAPSDALQQLGLTKSASGMIQVTTKLRLGDLAHQQPHLGPPSPGGPLSPLSSPSLRHRLGLSSPKRQMAHPLPAHSTPLTLEQARRSLEGSDGLLGVPKRPSPEKLSPVSDKSSSTSPEPLSRSSSSSKNASPLTIQLSPRQDEAQPVPQAELKTGSVHVAAILDSLLLGNEAATEKEAPLLAKLEVTDLVNVCGGARSKATGGPTLKTKTFFCDGDVLCLMFLVLSRIKEGKRVLLQGSSQTPDYAPAFALAFLMKEYSQPLAAAERLLRERCGDLMVPLSDGVREQLSLWEERVCGLFLSRAVRVYQITKQSAKAPTLLVPKRLPCAKSILKPTEVLVLHSETALVIWTGKQHKYNFLVAAKSIVAQMAEFEKVQAPVELVAQGTEPPSFWKLFSE